MENNYDVVVANILADVIIPLSKVAGEFMKSGSIFISSGIIYLKSEAVKEALLENGFEIVTHPMSLNYQCCHMPWETVLSTLKRMGYTSHNADTCGFHCHISRRALGDTFEEQEDTIARILYFMEKHWEELVKFSRRTQKQLERWAARYGYKDSPKEILKKAKGGYGRYSCLNLSNDNTVEFRIFRGTLKTTVTFPLKP